MLNQITNVQSLIPKLLRITSDVL